MKTPTVPVARALVELLAARGIDRAFCVPGESYLPLLDALIDSPVELVVCRHESGAGFAALADAQATRRPGLFLVSRGPGATNGSIAIHSAMHDALPLVMICGQVSRSELGRHAFQEVDYRQTFGDLAKWSTQVDDPSKLLETVARAIDIATSGRPGPVVVAVPEDVFEGEAAPFDTAMAARAGLSVDADAVRAVAAQLAAAERPLLIAGNLLNTPRGRMALSAVAHGFGVPVVVEFRQQDIFPNADRLYAAQLGFKIPVEQIAVLKQSDLLLAVGTDLGDVPTQGFTFPRAPVPEQPLIHVYPDAEVAARVYQPQLRCIADPVAFLEALARYLPARPDPREGWIASLQAYLQKIRRFDPALPPDGVSFGHVVAALERQLPDDGVLVVDAGNFNTWTQRYFMFRGERRMSGTMAGAMGMGVPGAMAWSLRFPDRTVVALVGDGCVMMTGNELATAVQYGAKPKIFIADNGSYGTIRLHQEKRFPGRVSGTGLRNPDFARWGASFGAAAFTLEAGEAADAIEARVAEALAVDGPAVVHVRTSLQQLSAFHVMRFVGLGMSAAVAAALAVAAPGAAMAQPAWPAKPVRMLVGYAPGGPVDIVGRLTAQRLSELLGQPVLVENRPGAGATIAGEIVARAAPDGYTLLAAGGGELTIAPSIYPTLGFNAAKDLAPIGLIASGPLMLVVNPRVPVQDVKGLVSLVRAQPGRINFASSGAGSTAHLASELFASMTGAQIVHIPYKGAGPALADLVGGQVDMMFTGVSAALPFVRAGKLRGLGVSGSRRLASLPEFAPVGDTVAGYDVTTVYALLGPAALPKDIVQRLNAELSRLLSEPGPRERLLALGAEPAGGPPEQLAAYIAREIPKWAKIVKSAKIKGE